MGTTAEKLEYLNTTKQLIKESINLTDANITNEPFRQYATILKRRLPEIVGDPSIIWNNYEHVTGTGTSFSITAYNSIIDYKLKGDTTQNGTPTPDAPVPVNVVTGNQEVEVQGEDLLANTTWTNGKYLNSSNQEVSNGSWKYSDYIDISGGNYIYNVGNEGGGNPKTLLYDINKNVVQVLNITNYAIYDLSSYNAKYIRVSTVTNNLSTIYKSNTYEINLGKNLFNINAIDTTKINVSGIDKEFTLTQKNNNTNTPLPITFENNKTYTFSGYYSSTYANFSIRITYTDNSTSNIIGVFDNSSVSKTAFSFTSSSSKSISMVEFRIFGTSVNLTLYDFQVEKGSQATPYSPYFTPIELCKIGTYQDYIYKDNGSWYLHKEIGKVVLNGSESWQLRNTSTQGTKTYSLGEKPSNYLLQSITTSPGGYAICDKFIVNRTVYGESDMWGLLLNIIGISFYYSTGTQRYMYINTTEDLPTYLASNNATLYYILSAPTNTEITNYNLIYQLNAVSLITGLNNITVSGDLPAILDLTAIKYE